MPKNKISTTQSKQTIVTGGTGLLGAHLLIELSKTEKQIIAIKRPESELKTVKKLFQWYFPKEEKQFRKILWVDGDITDIHSLLKIFTKKSIIYHVAGKVSFNPKDKDQLENINVEGTANVVNAALEREIHKLCYVSSIAAIGRGSHNTMTHEETPVENLGNLSPYAKSKYEGEREVWRGMAEGLNAVIVNPTIILGPGNWNSSSVQLFRQVYKGLKFYTRGTNGYIAADDLAKIMIQLMQQEVTNQRFIINSENITYQQLFIWMAEALHVKQPKYLAGQLLSEITWRILKTVSFFSGRLPLITKETARTANSTYLYSNEKIVNQTGFRFKPVKKTIDETSQYFLQHLDSHH